MLCTKGHWEVGRSAGGSRNDLDKFATNPQYLLTLTEAGMLCLYSIYGNKIYLTIEVEQAVEVLYKCS